MTEFKALEGERMKEEQKRQTEELKSRMEERQKAFEKLWNNEDQLDEDKCKLVKK